jgi:diacylglycerol kinase (ATP)
MNDVPLKNECDWTNTVHYSTDANPVKGAREFFARLYIPNDLRYIKYKFLMSGRAMGMIYVVCNPTAGNGLGKRVGEKINAALDGRSIAYTSLYTRYPGHARELAAQAAAEGADTVLAIGGDGTAGEAAAGLAGTKTALGIIPAGTGNDFIKTIGIPGQPLKALEHILACPARPTDMGRINDRLFLNVSGAGFDVCVLEYVLKAKRYMRGLLPYLYGVIRTILSFTPVELTYQIDDNPPVTGRMLLCAAANGRIIGGGIPIAPNAFVDDGLFDVILVRAIPRPRMVRYLPGLLKGKVLTFPETSACRCGKIALSAPGMRMNVDGEICDIPSAVLTLEKGVLLIHR